MKKNWMIAGILAGVAAVLYFVSMATYAYPGESAQLMACWQGLDDLAKGSYPFMAVFAKALGAGNLLAPICGILAVVLVFRLVFAYVGWGVRGANVLPRKNEIARIAATSAAVVFMLTPAVRSAATHLEPRLFDFVWAMAIFALALPFFRNAKLPASLLAVGMGVMAALGFCDSVIFLIFAPGYLLAIAYAAINRKRKPYLALFIALAAFFLTLSLALTAFGIETSDFLKRIAVEFRAYYKTPGWFFVLIFATVPFGISLFSGLRSYNERVGLVQWIFHGAMSFVMILAIATPFSPSSLMEPFGVLPVVTSAFVAAVAGYLLAYWWLLRTSVTGLVLGAVLAFVMTVSSLWNLFAFDGDIGEFADIVARKIIKDMGDRRWIVTDGTLDSHLKLVAHEEGRDIRIVSLSRDLDDDYLEALSEVVRAENVGGERNGELRLSLSLGVLPFVQDWFSEDPSAAKNVVIFGAPDLWYSGKLSPIPEFLFFGADPSRVPDWAKDWKDFDEILKAPKGWGSYRDRDISNPVDRLRLSLRRHLGFVANNRGVWLQDQHLDDEAFAMYELVLKEIDRDNICAVFNEVAMVGSRHPAAMKNQLELERMLKNAVDDPKRRYILWRLGMFYGYIRTPDMFVRSGFEWAKSGRPGDALRQIRRAIDFVPTDKKAVLLNMMAALYASEFDKKQSRKIYEGVLTQNAKDHDALIGLMRLELTDGNSAKALEYLQRALAVAPNARTAQIEQAMVAMMRNDMKGAKALIKKITDSNANDMQAWSLLAAVIIQQLDSAAGERERTALQKELELEIIPAMERASGEAHNYYVQATKGFMLLKKGEKSRKDARDAFLRATKERPDITTTQDLVLGLDISLDDKDGAEVHARDVLRRNRNAPLANYVMGSLALGRNSLDEAESFLRKAATAEPPVAMALNDLAETLRRKKNYAEAERFARQAVDTAPELYVAWETLGVVLMAENRNLDEAESCIRKACELSKLKDGSEADVRMLISLARVQIRNNDKAHAKVTIRKVQSRIKELTDFERSEFEEVKRNAQ